MDTCRDGCQVGCQGLPLLPSAGMRNTQSDQHRSGNAVGMQLDGSTTQRTCHTGCKGTGDALSEVNGLQLDIVTVMNVRHIDTRLSILFALDAIGESHRLCLHPPIGREHIHGLHPIRSGKNGRKRAISIVVEFLHCHTSSESAATGQLSCVIEEIAVSLVIGDTAMVGERASITQRHNLSCISPRACRRRSRTVGDMLRHTTCGIEQLIDALALGNPRSFHV